MKRENYNYLNTKEKLLESIIKTARILKSNEWFYIANYIDKNIQLPDLDANYEYTLKWNFDTQDVIKQQVSWDSTEECYVYTDETKVAEIPMMVSVEEASKIKGVTVSYIRRLCREGRLNCKKITKDWVIDIRDL